MLQYTAERYIWFEKGAISRLNGIRLLGPVAVIVERFWSVGQREAGIVEVIQELVLSEWRSEIVDKWNEGRNEGL